jgi:hypothetical protein
MNSKGLSVIQILVGLAIAGLILVLCSIALLGARKEGRDVKRVSDMEVMRSSMAAVKIQFGSYAESGCKVGLVSTCVGGNLETILPTMKNFNDPSGTVSCATDCAARCNYALTEMSETNFKILFFLEKGIGNYSEPGCYALTAAGIAKK